MTESFDTYLNTILSEFATSRPKKNYEALAASTTAEQIKAAKEWVSECEWGNLEPEDIQHLTALELVRGIDKNYSGGWEQFLYDL